MATTVPKTQHRYYSQRLKDLKVYENIYKYEWMPFVTMTKKSYSLDTSIIYLDGQYMTGVVEANAVEGYIIKNVIASIESHGIGTRVKALEDKDGNIVTVRLEGKVRVLKCTRKGKLIKNNIEWFKLIDSCGSIL
ncbi:MAG: hypothetical protein KAS32_30155 [Candidatus Peribacteraceae bacterium]|nr:hypothetical protein [Candidatus Peribacteraceae bacterium]